MILVVVKPPLQHSFKRYQDCWDGHRPGNPENLQSGPHTPGSHGYNSCWCHLWRRKPSWSSLTGWSAMTSSITGQSFGSVGEGEVQQLLWLTLMTINSWIRIIPAAPREEATRLSTVIVQMFPDVWIPLSSPYLTVWLTHSSVSPVIGRWSQNHQTSVRACACVRVCRCFNLGWHNPP